jgi:hypothetical protein
MLSSAHMSSNTFLLRLRQGGQVAFAIHCIVNRVWLVVHVIVVASKEIKVVVLNRRVDLIPRSVCQNPMILQFAEKQGERPICELQDTMVYRQGADAV